MSNHLENVIFASDFHPFGIFMKKFILFALLGIFGSAYAQKPIPSRHFGYRDSLSELDFGRHPPNLKLIDSTSAGLKNYYWYNNGAGISITIDKDSTFVYKKRVWSTRYFSAGKVKFFSDSIVALNADIKTICEKAELEDVENFHPYDFDLKVVLLKDGCLDLKYPFED